MSPTRRQVLVTAAGGAAALRLGSAAGAVRPVEERPSAAVERRRIPKSGELLPMVGLGTSRTFAADPGTEQPALLEVVRLFLDSGGSLIDSSPMYGPAEELTGRLLARLDRHDCFFATKVWTEEGREAGIAQMRSSMEKMGTPGHMDLMQVHNLVDYATQIETLRAWKAEGVVRYVGITEMRDMERVEQLIRDADLDFVQIPYSISDRRVEERVLPAALENGVAVLVMRPFDRGRLFESVKDRALPDWAEELDCRSWAQFFLKYVLGHPAVTCPIPATSKPRHLVDNMAAGTGRVPDEPLRRRMVLHLDS